MWCCLKLTSLCWTPSLGSQRDRICCWVPVTASRPLDRQRRSCIYFWLLKKQPLRLRSVPPHFHSGKAWNVPRWPCDQVKSHVSLPRAQDRTLKLIIVVGGPESVLPDVLAIHTIEMIPKSMILTRTWSYGHWSYCTASFLWVCRSRQIFSIIILLYFTIQALPLITTYNG